MNTVKKLRIQKGLSVRELAKQSGIGSATITRLEGGGKAYATTLSKLADFFGVSFELLQEFEAVNPKSDALTATSTQGVGFFATGAIRALPSLLIIDYSDL